MVELAQLFEAIMILCFGLSWPISIRKSLKSGTAKGKSLFFEFFIWIGYLFGIVSKFLTWKTQINAGESVSWLFYLAWVFYFINTVEITFDMFLYFRNSKLDKKNEAHNNN